MHFSEIFLCSFWTVSLIPVRERFQAVGSAVAIAFLIVRLVPAVKSAMALLLTAEVNAAALIAVQNIQQLHKSDSHIVTMSANYLKRLFSVCVTMSENTYIFLHFLSERPTKTNIFRT